MSDEFYVLESAPNSKGYCTLEKPEGVEDKRALRQGRSLAANPPTAMKRESFTNADILPITQHTV